MTSRSATPFYLILPKESETGLTTARTRRYDINGVARFDGRQLVLEWCGRALVTEMEIAASRQVEEPLASGACAVPIHDLSSAMLRGRWWRPRLELTAVKLSTFAGIPGLRGGRAVLWLTRQDWLLAQELCSELRLAMAESALQSAAPMPELMSPEEHRDQRLDFSHAAALQRRSTTGTMNSNGSSDVAGDGRLRS